MAHNKRGIKQTRLRQAKFLELFEECLMVSMACKKLKIPRRTVYNWINSDELFKSQYEASQKMAIDLMEEEARRRAFHGVKEPVYQGGKKVGYVQKFSDTLLIFMLKNLKKETFADVVRTEHSGPNGEAIRTEARVISNVDYTQLPDEVLRSILNARIEVKDTE